MLKTRFVYLLLISIAAAIQSEEPSKVSSYDPGELLSRIFNPNITLTSRQRGYGLAVDTDLGSPEGNGEQYEIGFHDNKSFKFEDDPQKPVRFQDNSNQGTLDQDWDQDSGRPLKFEDQRITFQDNNAIDNKKKRRRRRKPKKSFQGRPGFSGLQQGAGQPNFGLQPGFVQDPYVNPGVPGPVPFRRQRRPRPSLATDALTSVTGALTSIALYDDYQCVPRLLCEAAGGGSLGSGSVLDSVAVIQPLLTLLSAYNGISSSPLFVFGRAVFLGMTSRGNTASCRYAYPQCPTDPEQLIHYLNNHNGGFFRFFNAPPNQNLEQFYQHLGQNGQFLGQNQQLSGHGFGPNDYGQYYGNQPGFQGQGNYDGLYQNQATGQQGYGFQNIGHQPGFYGQNYGSNYDYNTYGPNNVRYKIEKRIQNKPSKDDDNFGEHDNQWQFPDNTHNYTDDKDRDYLKFPENDREVKDERDLKRKGKSILFPENQYNNNAYSNKNYDSTNNQITSSSRPYYQNEYRKSTQRPYYHNYHYSQNVVNNNINNFKTTATPLNENYYYDHKHNFYVKKNEYDNNNYNNKHPSVNNNKYQRPANYANYNYNYDGSQTVYIVRGNGDPNKPEIVKVRPGHTVT